GDALGRGLPARHGIRHAPDGRHGHGYRPLADGAHRSRNSGDNPVPARAARVMTPRRLLDSARYALQFCAIAGAVPFREGIDWWPGERFRFLPTTSMAAK